MSDCHSMNVKCGRMRNPPLACHSHVHMNVALHHISSYTNIDTSIIAHSAPQNAGMFKSIYTI